MPVDAPNPLIVLLEGPFFSNFPWARSVSILFFAGSQTVQPTASNATQIKFRKCIM